MASTLSFDNLHALRSMPYEKYFGEMDLSEEEKKRRAQLAEKLEVVFRYMFIMYEDGADIEEIRQKTLEAYIKCADEFLMAAYTAAYIQDHAQKIVDDIVNSTFKNAENDAYWLSIDRAMLMAEDQANVIGNYGDYLNAILSGCTTKYWQSMEDSEVRLTHRRANQQTVDIFEPFQVGDSLMMFPKDGSLGASPGEIVNCRCVCFYGTGDLQRRDDHMYD